METNLVKCDMKIIELKAETYNGMLRLLKPGNRSIVLLVDQESKNKLVENFKKVVWPYRRNKILLFGYLCLDKNLDWYKSLLEQVLGCDDLKINKKNCVGTVLSLNGFKKYFRIYHPKHHEFKHCEQETDSDSSYVDSESDSGREIDDVEQGVSDMEKIINRNRNETVYTVDNLLDKLPHWLDKAFDGLTKRFFFDEWPEEIK